MTVTDSNGFMSEQDLLRRTPDLRSVADIRLVTLEDGSGRGQRLLIGRNAEGVCFEVAVDRGFDISSLSFKGTNIGWQSSVQMAFPTRDPDSEDGWGFFRNFDGFMVTCGLDHYSRPYEADVSHYNYPHIAKRKMPHHGRISTEKARLVGYEVDHASREIVCKGVVRQASVFGETLELRRRITLPIFGLSLRIEDTVTNRSFRPSDHAFMYHLNFGYPFLDEELRIDGLPNEFLEDFHSHPPRPDDGFGEKVDVIDSRVKPHKAGVSLVNPKRELSVSLSYSQDTLPKLAVWRAYQSGVFALGIEPRTDLRPVDNTKLQAGETKLYSLAILFDC